ncbi:MAG: FHA domain-containing protein [Planctomyces sp.]|nr:FHA domain-containing protein [Planctomyces sp.]
MPDAPAPVLRYAVGNATPIRLLVRNGSGQPHEMDLPAPYAIIGRARDCDVVLPQDGVGFRHAYLQVIGGRLACIDLLSGRGIQWDGPQFGGWVSAAHRFRIGDAWLQVFDDGWIADAELPPPTEFKPRAEQRMEYGALPHVDLELLNSSAQGTMWPINRVITLVGRDERCRITCADENISRVHCSLLLLPTGLWVIDLLGKGGVRVNGEPVRCNLLSPDAEFEIGRYRLRARYTTASPQMPAAPSDVAADPDKATFLTKLNKLFKVEPYGDALLLFPIAEASTLKYKEIHVEISRISELLTAHGFRHLVVDGAFAPILSSMVLDAIIGFGRSARGRVAFCHLMPDLLESVRSMNLDRIWPVFMTRAEALQYVFSA